MQTQTIGDRAGPEAWLRPAALALLMLILFSAALDRRNGLSVEMAGMLNVEMPRNVAAPAVSLTTEELIREMLTHD